MSRSHRVCRSAGPGCGRIIVRLTSCGRIGGSLSWWARSGRMASRNSSTLCRASFRSARVFVAGGNTSCVTSAYENAGEASPVRFAERGVLVDALDGDHAEIGYALAQLPGLLIDL
jgi:hypothetical protein